MIAAEIMAEDPEVDILITAFKGMVERTTLITNNEALSIALLGYSLGMLGIGYAHGIGYDGPSTKGKKKTREESVNTLKMMRALLRDAEDRA